MAYTTHERKLYELRAHRNGGRVRVDAEPVRAHVARLAETASLSTIANAAGIAQTTVSRIMGGKYATTSPEVAQSILALKGTLGAGTSQVSALGTRRRIQALRALGWPLDTLAPKLGVSPQAVSLISAGGTTHVRAGIRDAVANAYAELSMSLPRPTTEFQRAGYDRARQHAERMGWVPPLAWDDDTIDDPNATPDLGVEVKRSNGGSGRPTAATVEDVEWLLEQHPLITATELADRLGYADSTGVQNALKNDRGNRPDLLERLARNAEIAA